MCPLKHNQRPKTENPMENHNETDIYSASWVDIIPTVIQIDIQEQITTFPLLSRKVCSNENGIFNKILSDQLNVHGLTISPHFSQTCQSEISMVERFWWISVKFVKTKSAQQIWQFWQIFTLLVIASIFGYTKDSPWFMRSLVQNRCKN